MLVQGTPSLINAPMSSEEGKCLMNNLMANKAKLAALGIWDVLEHNKSTLGKICLQFVFWESAKDLPWSTKPLKKTEFRRSSCLGWELPDKSQIYRLNMLLLTRLHLLCRYLFSIANFLKWYLTQNGSSGLCVLQGLIWDVACELRPKLPSAWLQN